MREKRKDFSDLSCEDHIYSDLYDQYLCDFQEDIKKIIGKHRKPFHALSPEDVFSESNMSLIKYKKKILTTFNQETPLTQNIFKKIAYHYVKNCINWSHYKENDENHNKKRVDAVHNTEEGPKTTFDIVIETSGKLDEPTENAHDLNYKRFMHILLNYSYLLSESEIKVLRFLEKGLGQEDIAERLGVTHQAISFAFIKMKEKLNSQFNFESILNNDISNAVPEGIEALDSLFKPLFDKIPQSDKLKIKKFLLNNPAKKYRFKDINKILFNSKYHASQIPKYIRSIKLDHLVSRHRDALDPDTKEKVTLLFKKGVSSKDVSKIVDINMRTLSSFKGFLVQKGVIDRSTRIGPVFPKDASDLIIEMYKNHKSSKSIQSALLELNPDYFFKIRSIGARIGAFKRSNLIEKKSSD